MEMAEQLVRQAPRTEKERFMVMYFRLVVREMTPMLKIERVAPSWRKRGGRA